MVIMLLLSCVMSNSFATPWTVACQAILSMGFSRQEYCSGLQFPLLGDLPTQGSNLCLLNWQVDSLPLSHLGSPVILLFLHRHPVFQSLSASKIVDSFILKIFEWAKHHIVWKLKSVKVSSGKFPPFLVVRLPRFHSLQSPPLLHPSRIFIHIQSQLCHHQQYNIDPYFFNDISCVHFHISRKAYPFSFIATADLIVWMYCYLSVPCWCHLHLGCSFFSVWC